jgi:hypothetical protein
MIEGELLCNNAEPAPIRSVEGDEERMDIFVCGPIVSSFDRNCAATRIFFTGEIIS